MEFLTAKDVAKLLNASEWFVYKHYKLFGGVKLGKLLRFEKSTLEVILDDRLQASREMALRLLEEGTEISRERIPDQTGSQRRRGRGQEKCQKDEFGLYSIVCGSSAGREGKKDFKISKGESEAH